MVTQIHTAGESDEFKTIATRLHFLNSHKPFSLWRGATLVLVLVLGNYTSNSTYGINLHTLISSLSTKVDYNGFYNATVGQNPNAAYANVLCRGDLQLDACRRCIQNATSEIARSCSNYKQAVQLDEFCTLRYSNEPIFGIMEATASWYWWYTDNATTPDQFMADVRRLLDNLLGQAADGGSLRKVAAGNRSTVNFQTIFSLVQCTPDLSSQDCGRCLVGAIADIPAYCNIAIGCGIHKSNCNIRYEVSSFYNETRLQEIQALITPSLQQPPPSLQLPPSSSLPPSPPRPALQGKKDNRKTRTIIINVVVPIVVCLLLAVCACILLKKRTQNPMEKLESMNDIKVVESLHYDFREIKAATDDFSDINKLGQGGFGAVYKGTLRNGQEIAVKRLSMNSGQGDMEFKNEVLLVAKLQHRNLVRLLGFSMQGRERLLVYEFFKNTSLDIFIFDPSKRSYLDWETSYKIIRGISRGLLYLHEESRLKIIHRDLKASNILLDDDMNPKIADFGMARLCAADETHGSTNKIAGTHGYMSPEYTTHGRFSVKSDVFSFGVLILEIITGKKNSSLEIGKNKEDLLSLSWKCWCQRKIEDMIDPVLKTSLGSLNDVLRCIHIGLLCVQDNPTDRPTMASVVLMLSTSTISLPIPLEPTFFMTSGYNSKNVLAQTYDSKEFELAKSPSQNKLGHPTETSKNVTWITEVYPR